jgi:hypothetical protein
MINPLAVQKYLKQEVDSHVWMKKLSDAQLDNMLYKLDPRPDFGSRPLRRHQKVGFLLGVSFPQFFFMWDMGTGKTRVILELLAYFKKTKQVNKALVLALTDVGAWGWEEEIYKWDIPLKHALLLGTGTEKEIGVLDLHEGVAIGTYQGMATLLSQPKSRGPDKASKLALVPSWVDAMMQGRTQDGQKLANPIDALAFDESTAMGNPDSLWSQMGQRMVLHVPIRFELAGRPFGRDPVMIWNQYKLLDGGRTFGENIEFFRTAFYTKKKSYYTKSNWAWEYTFDKKKENEFYRHAGRRAIVYDAQECGDLPELVQKTVKVNFDLDVMAMYNKVVSALQESRGNFAAMKNEFITLRQIASGFVGFKDDDTGERIQADLGSNPKLDALSKLIDQVPKDRKGIIFHDFTYSGRKIEELLAQKMVRCGWIKGGVVDYPEMKYAFDNDPTFRWLIVQAKKGAYSLNLQAANYVFNFERPVPVIDYEQMMRRARRGGSKWATVFAFDLAVRNSVEEKIIDFHTEGADIFDALLRRPERLVLRLP